MLTIKNIAIKTNNQAEKLAALYFLASKIGCVVHEDVLRQTINGDFINMYPVVYFDTKNFIGETCESPKNCHLIEFSELANIDKILEQKNKPKIEVGKRYYFNDSSFITPIFIEHTSKYVMGGFKNNDFSLYSGGAQKTEKEMFEILQGGRLRD